MEGLVNSAFWDGRRVLVTGHTGFKGSWLVVALRLLGARVDGIALPPEGPHDLFVAAGVGDACRSRFVDVRDAAALAAAVEAADPEIVFHLAAQPLVRASYADPAGTWATNVMGTVHVLEACRRLRDVRAIVVVTSDKCSEHAGPRRPFVEDDRLGGHDPYSSSKAACEIAVSSWRASFVGAVDVGLATARAGNVIGGGDFAADRLVPDLVRSIGRRDEVLLRRPAAVRPWQHVIDPLRGYLMLAEALTGDPPHLSEAWNFGPTPTSERTVADLARAFADGLDRGIRWRAGDDPGPEEAPFLSLDSAKAKRRLGWAPAIDFDGAVRLTADGYRAALDGEPMRPLMERQLEAHLESRAPVAA